jgi:hypothetical protein
MGDPNTPEGKAQLLRQSPLNSAAKIKTPLLVIQGANDPRVNKRESDQIVIALRDRGFPVEYIVAPDEGHGFARPVNNMSMFATSEKFLARYLGGRYQESMTPAVATRLTEISVDVKTVTLPKKGGPAAAGAPKPAKDLEPRTASYKATIEVNGMSIPISVKSEIKEEKGAWLATETAVTPQGDIVDIATIEKGTLLLKHRVIKQGSQAVEFDVNGNKVAGTSNMGGESKTMDIDLGGSLFADGAGAFDVLGALPLAVGYATDFLNFDVQKQKPQTKQMKVVAVENVTVPAGTFEAYKIEIVAADNEADKQTVWIAKDSRKVVKIAAVLPNLGGALLTSELVP